MRNNNQTGRLRTASCVAFLLRFGSAQRDPPALDTILAPDRYLLTLPPSLDLYSARPEARCLLTSHLPDEYR